MLPDVKCNCRSVPYPSDTCMHFCYKYISYVLYIYGSKEEQTGGLLFLCTDICRVDEAKGILGQFRRRKVLENKAEKIC
jgi:hypothetical protein